MRETPLKTQHSRRVVGLPADAVEALYVHPAGDDPARDFASGPGRAARLTPTTWPGPSSDTWRLAGLPLSVRFHALEEPACCQTLGVPRQYLNQVR